MVTALWMGRGAVCAIVWIILIKSMQKPEQIHKDVLKFILEEIEICHQENTPTSRLTSLAMKIHKYFEKL
jgi:hypothetical protein